MDVIWKRHRNLLARGLTWLVIVGLAAYGVGVCVAVLKFATPATWLTNFGKVSAALGVCVPYLFFMAALGSEIDRRVHKGSRQSTASRNLQTRSESLIGSQSPAMFASSRVGD